MMEFWFVDGNDRQKLRLPVPPPEFLHETGQTINTVEVNDFGEYSIKGDNKLSRITIKSFFPAQYYSFCQYKNFPKPYDFVKIIETWEHNDLPMRLIITNTNINKQFYIETFTYGERAGSMDVDFELSLVEYRPITIPKKVVTKATPPKPRPAKVPPKPITHKVKKSDTLWDLARRYYKDPYKWPTIAKKNGIKNPRLLQIGIVLVIP